MFLFSNAIFNPEWFSKAICMTTSIASPDHDPLIFEEYFELGKEETSSPFLTRSSRHWGFNLTLKSSIISAFLLLLSFIFSFFPNYLSISHLLLVGVYFLAGIPSLIESIEELLSFEINIDILMTLAAFSSVLIGSGMEGGLLLVLFALSGSMEDFVTSKAKDNISSLHKLSPNKACFVAPDGSIIEKSVKDIEIGMPILIRSGQMVPLDGTVISGISSVNLVHLTGENQPIRKQKGDLVPAGARNLEGTLTLQVTRTSADSTLSKIIELVTQAQEERPRLQRWFDRLSKSYAITIMSLAGFFALSLPFLIGIPYLGIEGSIYRALAFLIAASPCALIIAIPIAYLSAIGACARNGILLKGGISLDALAACTAIAFDKTGTLTTGNLKLKSIEPIGPVEIDMIKALSIAYAMEKNAVHPIAKAIVNYGQERGLPNVELKNFKSIAGYGLSAEFENTHSYIGNFDYILTKIDPSQAEILKEGVEQAKEHGELVAVLLIGSELFLLHFQDTLRTRVQETISDLKKQKIRLIMLTGDHENSARQIADQLDLDEYHANLKPEDKLHYVAKLSSEQQLAMIGDGVNDAPALARATVGVCMGKVGSTAAIDAADIILLQDNIDLLGWLMKKARQTVSIVKQNLTLATLVIIIASVPALSGLVPLWLAVIMHEGGTVLVGLNGLRLLKRK